MNTYLVRLASRGTGAGQRILVRAENPDGMQEFVDTIDDLVISDPVVISVHELRTKRPEASIERVLTSTAG